jgi:hypothetical protein
MMINKAGRWVAMAGLVAAGLALGDSASAKTLGALLTGDQSQSGEYYTQCFSNAHIFALAIKTVDAPTATFRCEASAYYADTWVSDSGCHPNASKHRVQIRTSNTVLAEQLTDSVSWTNATQITYTANSRVNGAGSCANHNLLATSLGW